MNRKEMIQDMASDIVSADPHISWDKAVSLAKICLKRGEKNGMYPPRSKDTDATDFTHGGYVRLWTLKWDK